MLTYAVDLHRIAVYVKTNDTIETFVFHTKQEADKKILALIASGYTFDPAMWSLEVEGKEIETC